MFHGTKTCYNLWDKVLIFFKSEPHFSGLPGFLKFSLKRQEIESLAVYRSFFCTHTLKKVQSWQNFVKLGKGFN